MANGQLRIVLEEFEPLLRPLSLVYPSQRQVPLKLRAFLDFATTRLREMLDNKPKKRLSVELRIHGSLELDASAPLDPLNRLFGSYRSGLSIKFSIDGRCAR